jgi:hypothetical protein
MATIVNEDFGDATYVNVDGDDHDVGMWERS